MHSYRIRFIVFFVLFSAISFSLLAFISNTGIKKTGEVIASEQGFPVCEKALEVVNADKFAQFLKNPTEDDPFYEETRIALLRIKEIAGCDYLYTMAPVQDTVFRYIIDGSCDPSDEENFSPLGTEEDIAHYGSAPFEALKTGKMTSSGLTDMDEWGLQVSTYAPIITTKGETVGFIGCDFPLGTAMQIMEFQGKIISLFSCLMAIIGILFMFFMMRSLFNQIKKVSSALEQISQGNANLTLRVPEQGKNEITILAKNFNKFSEKLQGIIASVKDSETELSTVGSDMESSIMNTEDSINKIISSIDDVDSQIQTQSLDVQKTAEVVNSITKNISSLEILVKNQNDSMATASSAVEQMVANIRSVDSNVEVMASSFVSLEKQSAEGQEKQNNVNEKIMQIEEESKMLQEANTAISDIAEQTNLLAMNAAIEAAHAGEAGKGFAVVADEIRKLSETSSAQSKTIGDQLTSIESSITQVVQASEESRNTFNSVSAEIARTNTIVKQIKLAMDEQNEGSKQVLDALGVMNESFKDVSSAAQQMSDGSKVILQTIGNLEGSSNTIKTSMKDMTVNADQINTNGKALDDISEKMKSSIDVIADQMKQFTV